LLFERDVLAVVVAVAASAAAAFKTSRIQSERLRSPRGALAGGALLSRRTQTDGLAARQIDLEPRRAGDPDGAMCNAPAETSIVCGVSKYVPRSGFPDHPANV
jgi:hypothetical protein